jgi:sugar/nucleoside kinase (ribokinase family)
LGQFLHPKAQRSWGFNVTGSHDRSERRPIRRVIVIGDIMSDIVIDLTLAAEHVVDAVPPGRTGGTAFRALEALKRAGFETCVIGAVGDDSEGVSAIASLQAVSDESRIDKVRSRSTGRCLIVLSENAQRRMFVESAETNDLVPSYLAQALHELGVNHDDVVLLFLHCLARKGRLFAKQVVETIERTGARLLIDVVPHDLGRWATWEDLCDVVASTWGVIIELQTCRSLLSSDQWDLTEQPSPHEVELAMTRWHRELKTNVFILRYGFGNVQSQVILEESGNVLQLSHVTDTGFRALQAFERLGFGDALTAAFLQSRMSSESQSNERTICHQSSSDTGIRGRIKGIP